MKRFINAPTICERCGARQVIDMQCRACGAIRLPGVADIKSSKQNKQAGEAIFADDKKLRKTLQAERKKVLKLEKQKEKERKKPMKSCPKWWQESMWQFICFIGIQVHLDRQNSERSALKHLWRLCIRRAETVINADSLEEAERLLQG